MTLASMNVCQSLEEMVENIHSQARPWQHAPKVIRRLRATARALVVASLSKHPQLAAEESFAAKVQGENRPEGSFLNAIRQCRI